MLRHLEQGRRGLFEKEEGQGEIGGGTRNEGLRTSSPGFHQGTHATEGAF